VGILGPLGNRFELPKEDEAALMVGGGVGIPPMLYLAEKLAGRYALAFAGALTRDLLPLTIDHETADQGDSVLPFQTIREFARHGIGTVVTTDDGSLGYRGFVTQALEKFLDVHMPKIESAHLRPLIYTCGPEGMMKRVADIARARGIECQVAVERAMACGMGTCQSCVIRVREGDGWRYRLACTDGPVFRAKELLW
jgi:dihydroorotate dehydrogenase electron transfer subunit